MVKYKEFISAPAPRAAGPHAPTGALTSRAATDEVNGSMPGGVGVLPGRAARRPGGPASGGGLPFGPESLLCARGPFGPTRGGLRGRAGGVPPPEGPARSSRRLWALTR